MPPTPVSGLYSNIARTMPGIIQIASDLRLKEEWGKLRLI